MSHLATYAIVPAADVTSARIQVCLETNMDSVRYSLDMSLAVLKYNEPTPLEMLGYTAYTHVQILVVVTGPGWQEEGG